MTTEGLVTAAGLKGKPQADEKGIIGQRVLAVAVVKINAYGPVARNDG
ncbi:MAG: hypothetical protein JRE14_07680, partial [Deltaproteobacteria bacterium]|nr:hypothetical protein [Deltaproteobacteria bacterium]